MERTQGLFEDLLNVEVNTIIKTSITAEKMPPVPFALLDIVEMYGTALAEFGVPVHEYFASSLADCWAVTKARAEQDHHAADTVAHATATFTAVYAEPATDAAMVDCMNDLWTALEHRAPCALAQPHEFVMGQVHNGWDTFERLRIAALEHQDLLAHEHQRMMISRIANNCSRLKYVVQGLQQRPPVPPKTGINWRGGPDPMPFASLTELIPRTRNQLLSANLRHKRIPQLLRADDLALVRKCWEVGVERVLLQTSVQVDGDVITRIAEELIDGRNAQVRELVMSAHQRSLDISLKQWKSLFDVAVSLVKKLSEVASFK
jgi:hypothetical protein